MKLKAIYQLAMFHSVVTIRSLGQQYHVELEIIFPQVIAICAKQGHIAPTRPMLHQHAHNVQQG